MKKEVLFLAPSYAYAKTVVTRMGQRLDTKEIPYNRSVYPHVRFSTDGVNVTFIYSDPLKWTSDMLQNKDVIFGKKELVDKLHEKFPHRAINRPKMSLDKYVIENSTSDAIPVTPPTSYLPEIKTVHFNGPATVVLWADGTKTMVKCQEGDIYSEETGLAVCIAKKAYGNMPNFNNIFRKWVPEETASNKWAKHFARTIEDGARRDKAIRTAYRKLVEFRDDTMTNPHRYLDINELIGYLGEALD